MPVTACFPDYERTNYWLLKTTCVFWLIAKLIGWRMFTTYRVFPTAPLFESFDQIPPVVHTILFAVSLLLIAALLFTRNSFVFLGLLIAEVFSFLPDQNRLQPWEYQYLFIVVIFIINAHYQKLIPVLITFILAATYIYSGLGKLNESFLNTIWTKMLLELFLKIPPRIALQPWVHYCGLLAGLVELVAGIGLLFSKTRKPAAVALIIMHLFILVFLGPLGLWYNRIVWPWNVAMIFYLYLLFFKKQPEPIQLKSVFTGWNKLVFICWGILPALNFVGLWDNYLSCGVYSGKLLRMVICIKDTSKCKPLQRYCRADYHLLCNGQAYIDLQYWAMSETNVAPYPEIRVYETLAAKLSEQYKGAGISCVFVDGVK
jgi:hypothetical protein